MKIWSMLSKNLQSSVETRANHYRIGEQSFQGEEGTQSHNGTMTGGVGQGRVSHTFRVWEPLKERVPQWVFMWRVAVRGRDPTVRVNSKWWFQVFR